MQDRTAYENDTLFAVRYRNTVVISGTSRISDKMIICIHIKGRKPRNISGNVICGGATDFR
jgi:hypothetical protein